MTTANEPIQPMARTPAESLERMRAASNHFYFQAVRTGNHAFIEFTGLMNEYIKLCEDAYAKGEDFMMANIHTDVALPMQTHHAAYLGEKFGCIFFASFAGRRELLDAFVTTAFPGCKVQAANSEANGSMRLEGEAAEEFLAEMRKRDEADPDPERHRFHDECAAAYRRTRKVF